MVCLIKKQLREIKDGFDKIASAKGKAKEGVVVTLFKEPNYAQNALRLLLDPAVVFHIGDKSFQEVFPFSACSHHIFEDFFELCQWMCDKKALTNADVATVEWTLAQIEDKDLRAYARDFLCKKITLGVTAKTVNKALDFEFIPEFRCMLANKYFEHPDKVEGKHFYLTEKLDGIRCVAVVKENGVQMFSRQGVPIEGLVDVNKWLLFIRDHVGKDFVFDGELLISGRDDIPSKEQYKRTTMIVRREGIKRDITYNVFDVLDLDAFESRSCEMPYYQRRQKLDSYCMCLKGLHEVVPLPVLYHGTDTSMIMRHLNAQRTLQHEGVMINLADETYQFGRTNALLKVKVMQDCDLEIIGFEAGKGKFEGTLGALVCDYKGTPVGVGSGLTDEDRRMFWDHQDEYLGRVATIQYFESTHDKDGKESLRFPVFKDICPVGKEVSYN